MGTFVVLSILMIIVALIIRKMYRDKKNGVSLSCGKKCSECGGGCGSCSGCGSKLDGRP